MTKKVVINRCWGGFGLSHKAIMRYAELSGFELFPMVNVRDRKGKVDWEKFVPYTGQENAFSIHYSKSPINKDGTYEKDSYWYYGNISREDPILVKIVEELGVEANGEHASLEVIEIPEDVNYEIDDYDGQESIHEIHRSW